MSDRPDAALARIRIVLARPQHPGNIGSAARAMLTMGLTELVLVAPRRFPDPEADALASHARPLLEQARVVASLDEAVADCAWVVATSSRQRHLGDEPLRPEPAARQLVALAQRAPVALVFGCERTGLTNEELQRCQALTYIPANPDYASLNLASAVQLLCYELRKAAVDEDAPRSSKTGHPVYAPSSAQDMERFYEHLERVLLGTGFLDPRNPGLLMSRLRTLYNRARPDRNELAILRGILTSVERPKRRSRPSAGPEPEAAGGV
ncbi:MAG TPA: RNA methyltransferase [Nevskiaceae bacterium]|nr:RNA methyltransferase [Nevskiaceae bacterium]